MFFPFQVIGTIFVATFAFVLTLFLVRFVGRKTVSQISFFDFILAVSIGTIAATIAIGPNRAMATVTLAVFIALTILLDYVQIESFSLRKLLNSEPVEVIRNGKINDENLRKTRITIDQVNSMLRQKNIFNIADVEFAILETNGELSVLPKSQKQPLTPSDLGIPTEYKGLTKDIVMDGEILHENLHSVHLDEGWLMGILHSQGIKEVHDVFYAGLDTSGNLYVSLKNKSHEKEGEHGFE